jgi:hypothetical protein
LPEVVAGVEIRAGVAPLAAARLEIVRKRVNIEYGEFRICSEIEGGVEKA